MPTPGEVIIGPLQKIVREGNSYTSVHRSVTELRFRFSACGRDLGWSEPLLFPGTVPSREYRSKSLSLSKREGRNSSFFTPPSYHFRSSCGDRRRAFVTFRWPSFGYGVFFVQFPVSWPSIWDPVSGSISWLSSGFDSDLYLFWAYAQNKYADWRANVFQRYRPKFGAFSNPGTNLNWSVILAFPTGTEGSVFPTSQYGNSNQTVASRSATSVNTPGFRSKKGLQLPVNPYSCTLTRFEPGTGYYFEELLARGYWRRRWHTVQGILSTGWPPPQPAHDAQVLNKAISNLIQKNGIGLTANNAQNLAQAGQTYRLINNTIWRFVGVLRALRRGNFAAAQNAMWNGRDTRNRPNANLSKTNTLANNWLEMQYGWKPLLNDIDGSIKATAKLMSANTLVTVVRGSSRKEKAERTPCLGLSEFAGITVGHSYVTTVHAARIGIRYKISDHTKVFLAQTGFTNPVNLAWEILPFSFVVDWFLPIGPWLEHLSAFDGLTFVDGFQTQFTKQTGLAVIRYYGKHLSTYWAEPNHLEFGGRSFREIVLHNRAKLTTWPRMSLPVLKNPFSTTHTLNGLALLRKLVRPV